MCCWTLDLHLMFNVNIYFHHVPLNWVSLILPQVVLFQICDVTFPYIAFPSWMLNYEQWLLCRAHMQYRDEFYFKGLISWCKEFLNSAVYSVHFVLHIVCCPEWVLFSPSHFPPCIYSPEHEFLSFKYNVTCFILQH